MDLTPNKHPEGLPFAPEGPGWTEESDLIKPSGSRIRLLSEHNIVAVHNNNSVAWEAAFDALPGESRDRAGIKRGLTEEERRRLATLAILISKGVVSESEVTH
jgi:hypothetical protein